MYTKEDLIKMFGTWSSGNVNIDKIIQESQINNPTSNLRWIPYDNFHDTEHIADNIYYTLYSARLRNYMMDEQDCEYYGVVTLKELKDYRIDVLKFIKAIKDITIDWFNSSCFTRFFGISKNPSTQNYIIVMESHDDNIHSFLAGIFLKIGWEPKTELLYQIIESLNILHENNLIHCDLHSRNISMKNFELDSLSLIIDPGLCKLSNDLTLNSDNKNNNVYGSIPYIPPEVLRGNEFTKEGDIYSFGGIMYEMATGNQPFSDQAHDTYLMIDICNGVRPKVPDMMLNLIPKCYLDLMYRCWHDDPSKRPTAQEISDIIYLRYSYNIEEEFLDGDLNRERMYKSHEQKLLRSLYNFHPQSCYISREICTLYKLQDSLEDIKSGKCADPNLYTYYIDSEESSKCIDLKT
ncbi:hypothetical protein Glove_109g228 [Diversispora epigaea]|uniref:Protein kinase domain-containing protein n=1 Tax=Diversispora epigaea TaxID=1348612 RepID=A0A397J553_9GLOM|nr:hypothetical protein Glove_109g228 [Diversispora epigaea]